MTAPEVPVLEVFMRSVCAAVVAALVLGVPLSLMARREEGHVRAVDTWASEALERGLSRSALVRQLVAALDASDLIVHLQTTTTLPMGTAGTTRLVSDATVCRYARIDLDRDLQPNERAAILAHELQHALELAESQARDDRAVRALYDRIGQRVSGPATVFETVAAQRAGARAWMELHSQTPMSAQR